MNIGILTVCCPFITLNKIRPSLVRLENTAILIGIAQRLLEPEPDLHSRLKSPA